MTLHYFISNILGMTYIAYHIPTIIILFFLIKFALKLNPSVIWEDAPFEHKIIMRLIGIIGFLFISVRLFSGLTYLAIHFYKYISTVHWLSHHYSHCETLTFIYTYWWIILIPITIIKFYVYSKQYYILDHGSREDKDKIATYDTTETQNVKILEKHFPKIYNYLEIKHILFWRIIPYKNLMKLKAVL